MINSEKFDINYLTNSKIIKTDANELSKSQERDKFSP